jgi:uncharacterized protein (DUF433 family)
MPFKGTDRRNLPAYPLSEAARYLKVPPSTLRTWVAGRPYHVASGTKHSDPLIVPASSSPLQLSFWNLIEAHVLRAFRQEHGVALSELRSAMEYAQDRFKIERLLLSKELGSSAGNMFIQRYGELIHLSASAQLAMTSLFREHLSRVEWDENEFPIRLHPVVSSIAILESQPIAIDPVIACGRPVVKSRYIETATIAMRLDAGETPAALAADYDLSEEEVAFAAVYEHAA